MKYELSENELKIMSACLAIAKHECLAILRLNDDDHLRLNWREGLASESEDSDDKLRKFIGEVHALELKVDTDLLPQAQGILLVSPFGQEATIAPDEFISPPSRSNEDMPSRGWDEDFLPSSRSAELRAENQRLKAENAQLKDSVQQREQWRVADNEDSDAEIERLKGFLRKEGHSEGYTPYPPQEGSHERPLH